MNKTDIQLLGKISVKPPLLACKIWAKSRNICRFLLSKTSKDMCRSFVPMLFPVLETHASGAGFMHSDQNWKEMHGKMDNLVVESGAGKSRLPELLEAICPDFLQTAKWLTSREVGS